MHRKLLGIVIVFYALFGAFNLASWFMEEDTFRTNFPARFVVWLDFFWAIMSFLIVYSLWKLKWWGRLLAICFNIFVLVVILPDLIFAFISDQVREVFPVLLMQRLLLVVILFGLITFFLFRKDVKELMRSN
jgi:hypothetical protein